MVPRYMKMRKKNSTPSGSCRLWEAMCFLSKASANCNSLWPLLLQTTCDTCPIGQAFRKHTKCLIINLKFIRKHIQYIKFKFRIISQIFMGWIFKTNKSRVKVSNTDQYIFIGLTKDHMVWYQSYVFQLIPDGTGQYTNWFIGTILASRPRLKTITWTRKPHYLGNFAQSGPQQPQQELSIHNMSSTWEELMES